MRGGKIVFRFGKVRIGADWFGLVRIVSGMHMRQQRERRVRQATPQPYPIVDCRMQIVDCGFAEAETVFRLRCSWFHNCMFLIPSERHHDRDLIVSSLYKEVTNGDGSVTN